MEGLNMRNRSVLYTNMHKLLRSSISSNKFDSILCRIRSLLDVQRRAHGGCSIAFQQLLLAYMDAVIAHQRKQATGTAFMQQQEDRMTSACPHISFDLSSFSSSFSWIAEDEDMWISNNFGKEYFVRFIVLAQQQQQQQGSFTDVHTTKTNIAVQLLFDCIDQRIEGEYLNIHGHFSSLNMLASVLSSCSSCYDHHDNFFCNHYETFIKLINAVSR